MLHNSLNYFLGYKMLTAQDLIKSRNLSRKVGYVRQPTLEEIQAVVTKLTKQQTSLILMRKHYKLKGAKLNRNLRQEEIIKSVIKDIMGGGGFSLDGRFLNTPRAKVAI